MKKRILLLLLPLVVMLVAGCGGSGSNGGSGMGSGTLVTLTISPSASVIAGGSVSATAVLTTTKVGASLNELNMIYTSNRPDLVHFSNSIATNNGSGSFTVKTNISGTAQVFLNIDNSVPIPAEGVPVTVSATCAGAFATVELLITAPGTGTPTGATPPKITQTLSQASIAISGQAIATAVVTDTANNPLSGQVVKFDKSPATGPVTVVAVNGGLTDSSGKAFALLTGTTTATDQNVFINAQVTTTAGSASTTTPLKVLAPTGSTPPALPQPSNITVTMTKNVLNAGESSLATATVTDLNGAPFANGTVAFAIAPTTTHATATVIAATTDSQGKAYAFVTGVGAAVATENAILSASVGTSPNTITSYSSFTIVPPGGSATESINLTLATDLSTIDQSIGSVIATATLKKSDGTPIAGQPVTFSVPTGNATVSFAAGITSVDGTALATITPSAVTSTQNVLVKVSTTVSGVLYEQLTSFKIVRGAGVVTLTAPTTTTATAKAPAANVGWVQLIPFTLTDSNGNPRAGISVNLSVLSQTAGLYSFVPDTPNVISDASGSGVFSVTISGFRATAVGSVDSAAVVWRASTPDGIIGYASGVYSVTGN